MVFSRELKNLPHWIVDAFPISIKHTVRLANRSPGKGAKM